VEQIRARSEPVPGWLVPRCGPAPFSGRSGGGQTNVSPTIGRYTGRRCTGAVLRLDDMQSLLGRELTPEERPLEALLRRELAGHERRPVRSAIRDMAARSPKLFLAAALSMLESTSLAGDRRKLYMQFVECPEFLLELVHPDRLSRTQLIAVCQELKQIDDFLDLRLARLVPGRHADEYGLPPETILRLLDVLHMISSGPRLVQVLGHLTGSRNERIASKATILMGHRLRSENWVRNHFESKDARLRASVVEGLWGVDTPFARNCLRQSLNDGDNRVAGNALFGLHLLGEQAVDRQAEQMLGDSRPNFRRTAAWVMGRIGKPEFVKALERAAQEDEDAGVRETAARTLAAFPISKATSDPQPAAAEASAPPGAAVEGASEKVPPMVE
jgi:HEAT repeats